jgi:hypothetical protein
MSNIYEKLSKASQEADKVIKAPKKTGLHFNPLLHDAVQKVAMEALNKHGLYPVCNYENTVTDKYVFIKCEMTIHDTTSKEFVLIQGCSAFGATDRYGTGNAMSYSRKYAFLNALNLETGLDNEDGYKAKPFKAPTVSAAPIAKPIPKVDTTKLANDWIAKLKNVAKLSASPNKFENNIQIQMKEFESELKQIKSDPIEDIRVDTEYTKLKSQIQKQQGSNNGRV